MPKFFVKHGSVKVGRESKGVGSVLDMTDAEREDMDPKHGFTATEEEWAALQAKAKAEAVLAKPAEKKPNKVGVVTPK